MDPTRDGARERVEPLERQQNAMAFGGLIAIALLVVQDFLGLEEPTAASTVSMLAFSVALPLLAVSLLADVARGAYTRASTPAYLSWTVAVAVLAAYLGVVAALWHASVLAAGLFLAASGAGLVVLLALYARLERDNPEEHPFGREDGDA